jgi:hypothetical protein
MDFLNRGQFIKGIAVFGYFTVTNFLTVFPLGDWMVMKYKP